MGVKGGVYGFLGDQGGRRRNPRRSTWRFEESSDNSQGKKAFRYKCDLDCFFGQTNGRTDSIKGSTRGRRGPINATQGATYFCPVTDKIISSDEETETGNKDNYNLSILKQKNLFVTIMRRRNM